MAAFFAPHMQQPAFSGNVGKGDMVGHQPESDGKFGLLSGSSGASSLTRRATDIRHLLDTDGS
jgi:hypothetical protein